MKDIDEISSHIQSPGTLASLHFEILSRILMHVENSDIPAVMLTCKTLCSVIMTRQFWYHRIHRLCKEHLVSPPEEELEGYTIAELETWTLRRIRARCTLPTQLHLRRQHTESSFIPNTMELLPGGRWLLATHQDLRVCFFDLDSNDLEQHLLFDPKRIGPNFSNCSILRNHMWIDHQAPRLSFRYTICILDEGDDGLQVSLVQIYQINLIGHGAGATLVAQVIATFRTLKKGPVISCTFNDHYFVQGREYNNDDEIEVYDYRPALGRLDYPLIECHTCPGLLGENFTDMQFINEDVFILVHSWDSYHVFNIESPTSVIRLHIIDSCQHRLTRSRVCWTPEASLITRIDEPICERDYKVITVHGLVIPHNSTLNPWSIELGKFKQRYRHNLRLGIFISMSCNQTDNITRIGHEWDFMSQNSNPVDISILEHGVDKPERIIVFDEDTGRSVHFGSNKMGIVDIAGQAVLQFANGHS